MQQEMQFGLDYLRRNHAPKIGGNNEGEIVKNALSWTSYQQALDDIEEVLTSLSKEPKSLDESPLEN